MNPDLILARHYSSGRAVRLRRAGTGAPTLEDAPAAPEHRWLAPALVDLQVNGFAGVDFQQDGLTLPQLRDAARALQEAGCARWLLTLITDDWRNLLARLRHLRALRAQSPELQHAIAGWHLEGPFLSSEPGFHGAHPAEHMLDPTAAHLHALRKAAGGDPLLLTLAPERTDALDAIRLATSFGFRISLGHTNASADVVREAMRAGATGFTHLANGVPQMLDRHDNILWRVLDTPGLTVGLIPDRIHVSPTLFRLLHRLLGPDSIFYVSDATAAAGAGPGSYTVGPWTVRVGEDQVVRRPGSELYAGSALRPRDGVWRAAEMLACPWQEAWRRFSEVPARFMGVDASRDWCLLESDPAAAPGTLPRVTLL
jgi:N-acetylglucosamine-6-phosphate deacetylase